MSDPRDRFRVQRSRPSRDVRYIRDMLDAIEVGRDIRAVGKERFLGVDEPYRYAAYYVIIRLAEASARISEETQASHPDIPWRDIYRMRTRLTHIYPDISDEEVWNVLVDHLDELADQLGNMQ